MLLNTTIRTTRGCQPYLYDVALIPEGKRVVLLGTDMLLYELLTTLKFLIDPYNIQYLTDDEFAEHLLKITTHSEYEFTLKLDDDDEIFTKH